MSKHFVSWALPLTLVLAACAPVESSVPAPPASPRPAALAAVTGTATSADAKPLAGLEVRLVDGDGNPLAGLPAATTDAEGRYALPGVPAGYTVMLQAATTDAEGRPLTLRSLTRSTALGATADLDLASTAVAGAVVEGAGLGKLNPGTFESAAKEARLAMRDEAAPPSLPDQESARAFAEQLAAKSTRLRAALDKLTSEIAKEVPAAGALTAEATSGALPACGESFDRVDVDRSGAVDFLEYQSAMRVEGLNLGEPGFKQRDLDGDGLIEEEETCTGRSAGGTTAKATSPAPEASAGPVAAAPSPASGRLENERFSTVAHIDPHGDGYRLEDSRFSTIAYMTRRSDGFRIEDSRFSTIGYLIARSDGYRIENGSFSTVGYADKTSDGYRLEDSRFSTVGYVDETSSGYRIEDSRFSTLGHFSSPGDPAPVLVAAALLLLDPPLLSVSS